MAKPKKSPTYGQVVKAADRRAKRDSRYATSVANQLGAQQDRAN